MSTNIGKLWELRNDPSYKILLDVIRLSKNHHILSLSDIQADEHASHNIAAIKGGIKALNVFESAIETEFTRRRQLSETEGKKLLVVLRPPRAFFFPDVHY